MAKRYERRNEAKELLFQYPQTIRDIKAREQDYIMTGRAIESHFVKGSVSDPTYNHAVDMAKDDELAQWRLEVGIVDELLQTLTEPSKKLIDLVYFQRDKIKVTIAQAAARLEVSEKKARRMNYAIVDKLWGIMDKYGIGKE